MRLMVRGNSKMGDEVGIFNLPAKRTCKPSRWCLEGRGGKPMCYALRNNCVLPSVVAATAERLRESRSPSFVRRVVEEVGRRRFRYVRVHSTGDFYSVPYVLKWTAIARSCPGTLFRTTTRRDDLASTIRSLSYLPNFVVRESIDPTRPPSMGLPLACLATMGEAAGLFKCPNDCQECGYFCWKSRDGICFDAH